MQDIYTNVLIIEDNPIDHTSATKTLDSRKFKVSYAKTLQEGLSRLTSGGIDIVLLDILLQDSKGKDAFNTLYSIAPSIPIVILTHLNDENLVIDLLKNGAQDYHIKGEINANILSRSLQYAIERKKTENTLREITEDLKYTNQQMEKIIEDTSHIAIKADIAAIELNQIFNTSADGMWVLSKDLKILRINDAFINLFGQTRESLVGKNCFDIFNGSLCRTDGCPVKSLLNNKNRVEYDVERADEKGVKKYFILTATPLKILDGQIIGFVCSYMDITDRKNAEEKLKEANEALTRLSVSDGLTQIANRRKFDEHLTIEWTRLKREKQPLSLILCDIDFFKLYNDSYGHQAGDACLKAVAKTIEQNVKRPADLAARYGGEEFAVILPNTQPEGALQLSEKIRKSIQDLKIPHSGSKINSYVTLSLGISGMVPDATGTPQILIEKADKALYKAKENGRNCAMLNIDEF